MRYKTKLYLLFSGVAVATLAMGMGVAMFQVHPLIHRRLISQAVSVAASAAVQMDGDLLAQIAGREDEQTAAYRKVQAELRKLRNAQRKGVLDVEQIYTLYPSSQDPRVFYFGVDTAETEEDLAHAGEVFKEGEGEDLGSHRDEPYSSGRPTRDQWGLWLSAYAPVHDSKGAYVATVGVDLPAGLEQGLLRNLLLIALVSTLAILPLAFLTARFLVNRSVRFLEAISQGIAEFRKNHWNYRIELPAHDEFRGIAEELNQAAKEIQEKERLKVGFAHYLSQIVLGKILEGKPYKAGGEKRIITVFFSGMRGFAEMSESASPEEVFKILNEYFESTLGIIASRKGVLDKLIGDSIMAEFGLCTEDAEHARDAVAAAIEMRYEISLLRGKWNSEGRPDMDIGIGIHTGEAIIGIVGSEERAELATIGDTVNVASRLEHEARQCSEKIIISEATLNCLRGEFPVRPLGLLHLRGREAPVQAYAVLPLK